MKKDEKTEIAVNMLTSKSAELGRLPKRSDFESSDVCFIKQKLGPWPRALERAGLKEAVKPSAAERSREKRTRAKERRKAGKTNGLNYVSNKFDGGKENENHC
ncbi:hypothetical protein [Ruminococcus sp. Marseille-P6503]|uniref:homing endonuclease associated repeat-containing protein n=1 Tax=Ruminococcus sp. Marseille-P6503 TaxID=2364796 RepID=UPI0019D142D4|nr:hypothetical protein [Ruminococcus sp. Marseille-P6503]